MKKTALMFGLAALLISACGTADIAKGTGPSDQYGSVIIYKEPT